MLRERPLIQELRSIAPLLRDNCDTTWLQASDLENLDYHGITLLVGERSNSNADIHNNAMNSLFKQRRALAVANEALIKNALKDTFVTLVKQGLERFVIIKGTALAYSIYPSPWLRPRSDCDLLINYEDRLQFSQAFEKMGFKRHFGISGEYVCYQQTFSRPLAGDSNLNIDLHWKISNRQCLANSFCAEELINRATNLKQLSVYAPAPSSTDSLLIACLHRLGHHAGEERLAWLYDIHLLAQSLNLQDWEHFIERAQSKKILGISIDALQLCQQLFNTQLPETFSLESATAQQLNQPLTEIKNDKLTTLNEPSQFLLQRNLKQWRYFKHDIESLDGVRAKLGFIRETLFPSSQYLRQKMATNSVFLAHLKRFKKGLTRFSRS